IEGELFGVERGAFTGSDRPRAGLIEQAAGGTLLLDEVGDIPPALQPKLLRAIQDKCIRRLGSTVSRPVDFRLVASTNRDLESMVADGTFREDLYYRLSAFTIAIPALRNRRDDIPGLVMVALREAAAVMQRPVPEVAEAVMAKLRSHPWPGNVRQLFNVVERALVLEDSLMLHEQAFPQLFDLASPPSAPPTPRTLTPRPSAVGAEVPLPQAPSVTFSPSEPPSSVRFDSAVMEMERRLLLDALERCDGNQTRAAELLAMPRRTFVYKLKRHGIRRGANHE
ncbi:MAG TPA: sigma 54-interacting transcriptional regulator, partial [Polyangiaceae bacterium]|nr:sigma 54-interacting transcriptional regulator [Polyangiaceae bacterium]